MNLNKVVSRCLNRINPILKIKLCKYEVSGMGLREPIYTTIIKDVEVTKHIISIQSLQILKELKKDGGINDANWFEFFISDDKVSEQLSVMSNKADTIIYENNGKREIYKCNLNFNWMQSNWCYFLANLDKVETI